MKEQKQRPAVMVKREEKRRGKAIWRAKEEKREREEKGVLSKEHSGLFLCESARTRQH
jgi:hypothetical protein